MHNTEESYTAKKYPPILPGPREWPVVQLSKDRKNFVQQVVDKSVEEINAEASSKSSLKDEIETALHREVLRIKNKPWRVDPKDDLPFWEGVKSKLVNATNGSAEKVEQEILKAIVARYANEIAGNFRPSSYRLVRIIVKYGFRKLLNASRVKGIKSLFSDRYTLQDKIHILGETEQIRELAKKGTVVMVPTHYSNLDSILIGWIIHTLGLPPFIYGAGLNLFNIGIFAYFMNSLGAYKVDRRKKNLLYLHTLKTYSRLAMERECHSIFFPGGTRSRSGKVEDSLKLGLLETAITAQRANYEGNTDKKIFIVPVAINYHFVLEAPSLINEYLKRQGQERYYVDDDQYSNSYKISTFLIKFFTKGSDISVTIGKAMDVLGNYVDNDGVSRDKQGREIATKDYFILDGEVSQYKQREAEYTRMLGQSIVDEYHKISSAFSSHLVAFVAFNMIKKQNPKLDLFDLLRLPASDQYIEYTEFREAFEKMRDILLKLHEEEKIVVSPHLRGDTDEVIQHGLYNIGMYHAKRPLLRNKKGQIITKDLRTLYYYHNRLDGYGLERYT